jgi:hypothetical protein
MKLGTAEALLQCAPREREFDTPNLGAGEPSAGSVNLIRGNDSAELQEVWAKLEQKLAHLGAEDSQILLPVMYDREGVLPCTTKGFHEIRTGDALPGKKNPY